MKRLLGLGVCLLMIALAAAPVSAIQVVGTDAAATGSEQVFTACATIESGSILDVAGNVIQVGTDQFGFNYGAHLFNGTYDSSDRVLDGKYWGSDTDLADDRLMMKWADSWISSLDCDGDHRLDVGLVDGVVTGVSRGWFTNHSVGDYLDADGKVRHYTHFSKIVSTGSYLKIVEDVYNDTAGNRHGATLYALPGLGYYMP